MEKVQPGVACRLTMWGQTPGIGGETDVEAPEVVEHLYLDATQEQRWLVISMWEER